MGDLQIQLGCETVMDGKGCQNELCTCDHVATPKGEVNYQAQLAGTSLRGKLKVFS